MAPKKAKAGTEYAKRIKKFYESAGAVEDMAREPGYQRNKVHDYSTVSLDMPVTVSELLTPVMKGKVLDVGIGAGPLVQRLKGARIYGLDVSKPLLLKAKERGAKAVLGAGERMPFRDGSFDSAVCIGVIGHVHRPGKLFAEINRVLKPGGRFVVNIIKKRGHPGPLIGPEFYRHFTKGQAREMLKRKGFVVERTEEFASRPLQRFKRAVIFYARKKK